MRGTVLKTGVVTAAVLAAVVPLSPVLVESLFGRGWYPVSQRLLTSFSNAVPFAVLDLGIVGAVLAVAWAVASVWRAPRGRRWRVAGAHAWLGLTVVAAGYLAFLALWGLNYQRPPVAARLDFDSARVTRDAVRALNAASITEMTRLRSRLPANLDGWPTRDEVARSLTPALAESVRAFGLPASVVPGRPKTTLLDPYFTRAGVSGMTDPFFLETLIASNLLPFEMPMVVAHEWGHLAGLARESDASFFGWVMCLRGRDGDRYSAWLEAFLHTLGVFDAAERRAVIARLPDRVRADLRAAAERTERDEVRSLNLMAWATYDRYLKANRVTSGVRSYSEVVQLMVGTRFEPGWRPVPRAPR